MEAYVLVMAVVEPRRCIDEGMDPMSLAGKKIVIIGGTSGIGFAVAQQAAAAGADVVVASSNQDRVDAATKRLGESAEGRRLDVADGNAIAAFFEQVGEFDHLVYTAGESLLIKPLVDTTPQEARAVFERRFWGAFLSAKYAAPQLRDGGSITFSSGVLAIRPLSGTALTAGITGGIEALSRALAVELAPLRVNVIQPGVIRTELWDGSVPDPEAFLQGAGSELLTRRVGTAEEAAAAYLFVLANAYVTGTTLAIDGGAALV
ncbi:SDR family oxidoreductase [Streptomyces sp. NBC_00048]|uniref:SDR family oxidoreductase n=2 Tax=unclassified Streptomyces TaxID=2593676 RepID=UPI003249F89C